MQFVSKLLYGVKTVFKFVFSAFFIVAGVTHFTNTPFFLKIMPDYIPEHLHLPAVYVSGIAEFVLGQLLLDLRTTRLAAWGLIALLLAVFPANIYAYQHTQEIFPDLKPELHFWRLPMQGVLILLAFWYTRPDRNGLARRRDALDERALDATPHGDLDLTGDWVELELQDTGEAISRVRLSQHGTAVFGEMQNKLAAARPVVIRGIVDGDRLLANYWRPDARHAGSGMIDLRRQADGQLLAGTSTWFSPGRTDGTKYTIRWERQAGKNQAAKKK